MIKFPILTRWGTFINCVEYIFLNFEKIKSFIDNLPDKYENLKAIILTEKLKIEMEFIHKHLFISDAILKLESIGLSLEEQLSIYFGVKAKLIDETLKNRFCLTENKNPELEYFFNLDLEKKENEVFRYINLTTVSAERSFSFLRMILSDQRKNILPERMFNYLAQKTNK